MSEIWSRRRTNFGNKRITPLDERFALYLTGCSILLPNFMRRQRLENLDIIGMWETIKKILQKQPGTCIIIEDGKPVYVVTKFSDYENSFGEKEFVPKKMTSSIGEEELLEKINQEIANWKAMQAENQAEPELEQGLNEDVKIEDLPL